VAHKTVWVLPEINSGDEAVSKLSLGLLTAATDVAEKIGADVIAVSLGAEFFDASRALAGHGVKQHYFFKDPPLEHFSAGAYAAALLTRLRGDCPRLFIIGDTALGRELAPCLAVLLDAPLVTGCARIDFSDPAGPRFYRPVYAGQLWQEVPPETASTILVTMDPASLDIKSATTGAPETQIIEPALSPEAIRVRHIEYLPADFQKVDVADAPVIIAAGMGAAPDDLFPLVEELAALLEGAIGATRPVIDTGKVPRERLIGQTGKVVGPDFYLALGVAGASHHVGGIQDSGKIVAVNRDPQAAIFKSSDIGISADLRDVLPDLIKRIKQARENGEIV